MATWVAGRVSFVGTSWSSQNALYKPLIVRLHTPWYESWPCWPGLFEPCSEGWNTQILLCMTFWQTISRSCPTEPRKRCLDVFSKDNFRESSANLPNTNQVGELSWFTKSKFKKRTLSFLELAMLTVYNLKLLKHVCGSAGPGFCKDTKLDKGRTTVR